MRSYNATNGSSLRPEERAPRRGSRSRRPINSGRWTSRVGCGWSTASICHPLTVVDDHSAVRLLCLRACADQQGETVKALIENTFRHYGLPDAIYVDNGSPWGDSSGHKWARFGVWLLKLGVEVIHSRPYHPQGRGKNERFHRTLAQEVFAFLEAFRRPGRRPTRTGHQGLRQLQRPTVESADGLPRRARRHSSKPEGRRVRHLLRGAPHRRHRLDGLTTRQASLRTAVSHLSDTNT